MIKPKGWIRHPLRISSISDIHIGTRSVDPYILGSRLEAFLFDKVRESDLVIIGGDVTDMSLSFGDAASKVLIEFFSDLFFIASNSNTVVVILRGTLSHDRDHLRTIASLHKNGRYTCPFYYVETLSAQTIPELGLKVACFPDNLPYKNSSDAIAVIKTQMKTKGWKSVDYAFVHGYFKHMLPPDMPHEPQCTFDVDQFDFVSRYVMVGHVHTHSQNKHILNNGSFDRLRHGEEEAKGFIYLIDDGTDAKIRFIENTAATPFVTIDLSRHLDEGKATTAYIKKLKAVMAPGRVCIRVIHPYPEVRLALQKFTAATYPNVRFTHHKKKTLSSDTTDITSTTEEELQTLTPPTKETLPDMVRSFLQDKGITLTTETIVKHLTD